MLPVYRRADTLVHGLHPLAALLLVAVLATTSLLSADPVWAGAAFLLTLAFIGVSGNWGGCRPFLRLGMWMAGAMALINPLVNHQGVHVLVYGPRLPGWGHLNITLEALLYGIFAGVRVFTVIAACGLLAVAVNPDELLDLLSRLALRSSLAAALAVRLYPGMVVEAARMRETQLARGERLEEGGPRKRLRSHLPLWQSLLRGSLDRAASIAEAMSSRGFGSGERTTWRKRTFQPRDLLTSLSCLVVLGSLLAARLAGPAYSFFPTPDDPLRSWGPLMPFLPAAGMLSLTFLAWGWRSWHWLRSRI